MERADNNLAAIQNDTCAKLIFLFCRAGQIPAKAEAFCNIQRVPSPCNGSVAGLTD